MRRTVVLVCLGVVGIVASLVVVDIALRSSHPPRHHAVAVQPWAPPAHLAPGESLVRSRIAADGTVVVDQWLEAAGPISRARLLAISDSGATHVHGTVLDADGVRVLPHDLSGTGAFVYYMHGARRVHLRYLLDDAVHNRSEGRAVMRTMGLRLSVKPAPTRTVVTVAGAHVETMACSSPGSTTLTPCGDLAAGRWSARLSGSTLGDEVWAAIALAD